MVVAAGKDNDVPAGIALHYRGARVFVDDLLREGRTSRTYVAYDKDLQ